MRTANPSRERVWSPQLCSTLGDIERRGRLLVWCYLLRGAFHGYELAVMACILWAAGVHCQNQLCCRVLSATVLVCIFEGHGLVSRAAFGVIGWCFPMFPPKMSPDAFLARVRAMQKEYPPARLRALRGEDLREKLCACEGHRGPWYMWLKTMRRRSRILLTQPVPQCWQRWGTRLEPRRGSDSVR